MCIAIAGLLIIAILAGSAILHLSSRQGVETYGEKFLFISVLLFMVLIAAFANFWIRKKRVLLFSAFIIALPLLVRIPVRLHIYTDSMHHDNFLSVTVAFVIIMLFAPVPKRSSQTLNTVIHNHRVLVIWYVMLIANAFVSQILNLGPSVGIAMVFLRVGVPILISLLVIEMAETLEDIKTISTAVILSLCLAVVMSYIGTSKKLVAAGLDSGFIVRSDVASFASWTMYATLLVTTMPVILVMIAIVSHKMRRILLWCFMAIFVFEILNTHTRGALLCLIPLLIVLVDRRWYKRVNISWIILFLIVSGLLFGGFVWTKLQMRPWGSEWRYDPSVLGRLHRISLSWEYIRDHPFVGVGFGLPKPNYNREIAYYVYNGFLSWWNFTGLGGMISFIAVCILSVKNGWRAYRSRNPIIGLMGVGFLAGFMGWMINQVTTADQLTYLHSIESVSFFYILVGLMAATKQITMSSQYVLPKK